MSFIQLALGALVAATIGCRLTPSEPVSNRIDLYPSPTVLPTQTPLVIVEQITTTPEPTQTPNVVVLTPTPNELGTLCVSAAEAVYLRATPNGQFYPIDPLGTGTQVQDTGVRSGEWIFVNVGEQSGWVHGDYLAQCQ